MPSEEFRKFVSIQSFGIFIESLSAKTSPIPDIKHPDTMINTSTKYLLFIPQNNLLNSIHMTAFKSNTPLFINIPHPNCTIFTTTSNQSLANINIINNISMSNQVIILISFLFGHIIQNSNVLDI